MIYTVIAEPRSGGVSLMNWIGESLPEFTIAQEPWYVENNFWVEGGDVTDVGWIKKYDNIFIREIYRPDRDFTNLINISDDVICLFRENWEDQIKSCLYQEIHEIYLDSYEEKEVSKIITRDMILYRYDTVFKNQKDMFQQYIVENNYTSVSYEKLYYGGGIEIIKNHFNINTDILFPLNTRHLKRDGIPVEPNKLKTKLI